MRGTLFVVVYSMIMIALFIVCCYLMTIVNPKPLPIDRRRNDAVPKKYPRDSIQSNYSIGYGLEKIPEGVDADEFRKKLMTTKYNYDMDQSSFERGQRVVPPIWPNNMKHQTENKGNVMKVENKSHSKAPIGTSSPAKGLRRSVNDNKINNQIESPGSVLLKIIDESGRKKIEIKFISREKYKERELLRPSRNSSKTKSNETIDPFVNFNQSSNLNATDSKDSVIKLKANDIIVLTVVDDSDILLDDSIIITESTEYIERMVVNSDTRIYSNKTLNSTKPINLQKAEKELRKELTNTEIYGLNLVSSNVKSTVGKSNNTVVS